MLIDSMRRFIQAPFHTALSVVMVGVTVVGLMGFPLVILASYFCVFS